MKIKTSLLDLLGKEVYAVFKQPKENRIIVLGKEKIKSIAFADRQVALRTTTGLMFLEEDVCLDLEQVKARINFLQKSIPIIKPDNKIILTK